MKPGFVRSTGEDAKAPTPEGITKYARQRLGCEIPVGPKYRAVWYNRLKEEMAIQGWSYADLVRSIEYCHSQGIVVRKVAGILYYVDEAKRKGVERDEGDLHLKVAEALGKETDEKWIRKLSLAQGKALERVYEQWVQAHDPEV